MDAARRNAEAYGARWRGARRLVQMRPDLWRELAPRLHGGKVLEIGAGLRPTVPPRGAYFADISPEALAALERGGGTALDLTEGIPLEDSSLAGVLAFEVLEHLDDDIGLLREISRTVRPGGLLACSVPLGRRFWSRLDTLAGHVRRYEPEDLYRRVREAGFRIDRVEYRFGRPGTGADLVASWMLRRIPRITNALLQQVVFPVQSAAHRRFGKRRWSDPDAPAPREATGVCLVAIRD